jgi:N-methylhydantoinase A
LHQQRYGFSDARNPIEIVNLRLRMTAAAEPYSPAYKVPVPGDGTAACYAERPIFFDGKFLPSPLYRREALVAGDIVHGPAMITEYTSATLLPPGCRARIDGFRNIIITVPA